MGQHVRAPEGSAAPKVWLLPAPHTYTGRGSGFRRRSGAERSGRLARRRVAADAIEWWMEEMECDTRRRGGAALLNGIQCMHAAHR